MSKEKKTIHVYSETKYMGNIMYSHRIPFFQKKS